MSIRRWGALTVLALAAAMLAEAGERHTIAYAYRKGVKSAYDVGLHVEVSTGIKQGGQSDEGSSETNIRLVMSYVPGEPGSGERQPLAVTFSDLEVDQDVKSPDGDFTVEIRGEDLKLTRGGTDVIDTKKRLRKELADTILREFAFVDQEGTVTVGRDGRVVEVTGPNEFRAFLSAQTGAGLFPLECPTGQYAPGESWTSKTRRVSKFRSLDISDNPISVTLTFRLESVEEVEGRRRARIEISSKIKEENLKAVARSGSGRGRDVEIESFRRETEGHVVFDLDRGEVIESELRTTLEVTMNLTVKNSPVKMTWKGSSTATTKLRPPEPEEPAPEAPAGEPAEAPAADGAPEPTTDAEP